MTVVDPQGIEQTVNILTVKEPKRRWSGWKTLNCVSRIISKFSEGRIFVLHEHHVVIKSGNVVPPDILKLQSRQIPIFNIIRQRKIQLQIELKKSIRTWAILAEFPRPCVAMSDNRWRTACCVE